VEQSKDAKKPIRLPFAIIALSATMLAVPAHAVEQTKTLGTIGTGTFTCAKFAKYDAAHNNEGQMGLIVQWAWGFMSAYNARAAFAATFQEEDAPNPITPPDAATVLQAIRSHCEKNPSSNVAEATLELISSLGGVVTSTLQFPASGS